MTTKLTLPIEKSVIERAKVYALNTGSSLSEIIENYLETIKQDVTHTELSSKLKRIGSVVDLPKDFEEEVELRSRLEKKHL